MNRRIAKKVRKNWKASSAQGERLRKYHQEVGPEGEALRRSLGRMRWNPLKSKYEDGWWPEGRLLHHLGIKKRSHYSQTQVQRSFNRLPRAEQEEWLRECRLNEVRREAEALQKEGGPWAYAARALGDMPDTLMMAYLDHAATSEEAA